MTVCPNGHESETADYCDQCGAKIGGAAPAPPATPAGPGQSAGPVAATKIGGATQVPPAGPGASAGPVAAPPTASQSATWEAQPSAPPAPAATAADALCPACATPRIGRDRYCEGCGHDFSAPGTASSAGGGTAVAAWEAIVTADHEYYQRVAPDDVSFPIHCPPRSFLLSGNEIRVGRRSASRGVQPEVDLSGAPEDVAISHLHALLLEQPDGSYALVDPGSTNGTTLNEDPTLLTANVAVPVADGDRVHLGAWTTITIRARRATSP